MGWIIVFNNITPVNCVFFQAVESHGRPAIRYSPKSASEVVGIWRNMTVKDVAEVLGKDVGLCPFSIDVLHSVF